jgi:hypothetical protein
MQRENDGRGEGMLRGDLALFYINSGIPTGVLFTLHVSCRKVWTSQREDPERAEYHHLWSRGVQNDPHLERVMQ